MTREENITAILSSYFSGFKDELIEGAVDRIMELRDAEGDYFKKEDVIREIALIPVETDYEYDNDGCKKFPFRTCDYDDVMRAVTNLPTYAVHVEKKGEWRRMSDLSEDEDDRYECSRCGNVIHRSSRMDLYTFDSWCGRCGSNNNPRRWSCSESDR